MRYFLYSSFGMITLLLAMGCSSGVQSINLSKSTTPNEVESVYKEDLKTPEGEPAYITVQHCLISFAGTPVQGVSRSMFDAEQLAKELFEKAQAGDDFDEIVKKHTDDSPPGIYRMANKGFEGDMRSRENAIYARSGMVPAFGNVGFGLEVGEYGLAPFDQNASPFGWHIIKRIK